MDGFFWPGLHVFVSFCLMYTGREEGRAWEKWRADTTRFAQLHLHGPALIFATEAEVLEQVYLLVSDKMKGESLFNTVGHPGGATKRRKQDPDVPSRHQ